MPTDVGATAWRPDPGHGGPSPSAERAVPPETPDRWLVDYQATLGEIDEALAQLRVTTRERARPEMPEAPRPRLVRSADDGEPTRRDHRGGYLDERLASARILSVAVRGEIAGLGRRLEEVRGESDRLDRQLGLALEELEFIRSEPWALRRPGNALLADDPSDDEEAEPAGPRTSGRAGTAAPEYHRYTEERYRRTVASLHNGRGTLWSVTVASSVLVSLGLVLLTLRFPQSASAPWLVAFPLVWLVPVPFFLAAFFGTHRILRQRSLDLGDPP